MNKKRKSKTNLQAYCFPAAKSDFVYCLYALSCCLGIKSMYFISMEAMVQESRVLSALKI